MSCYRVDMVVRERQLHEVALHEPDHVAAPLLFAQRVTAINLELVEGQRRHIRRGEAVDVAGRTADTAAWRGRWWGLR